MDEEKIEVKNPYKINSCNFFRDKLTKIRAAMMNEKVA